MSQLINWEYYSSLFEKVPESEFDRYEGMCRFNGCVHVNEPDCAVKTAVEKGNIGLSRYENYVQFYNEIKERKKY